MRRFLTLILIGVTFFFSTGASIIDQETKSGVVEVQAALNRLVQLEQARSAEQLRLLREEKESIDRLGARLDAFSGRIDSLRIRVEAISFSPPPTPTTIELPTKTPLQISEAQAAVIAKPSPIRPAVVEPKRSSLTPLGPYLVSGMSFLLLIILFVRMKHGEAKLRENLSKGDDKTFGEPNDFMKARSNAANPRIHVTGGLRRGRLP